MENKRKNLLIVGAGIIVVIIALVIIYNVSQRETYASYEPLFGSFVIENKELSEPVYPADFLLSTGVDTGNAYLVKLARHNGVDLDECWVYSYGENRVFPARKDGSRLLAYENGRVIGTFTYTSSKFLWFDYDEEYTASWRDRPLELDKALQGFVFPA